MWTRSILKDSSSKSESVFSEPFAYRHFTTGSFCFTGNPPMKSYVPHTLFLPVRDNNKRSHAGCMTSDTFNEDSALWQGVLLYAVWWQSYNLHILFQAGFLSRAKESSYAHIMFWFGIGNIGRTPHNDCLKQHMASKSDFLVP